MIIRGGRVARASRAGRSFGTMTRWTRLADRTEDPLPDPWEPPLAGTETEHLVGALERLRTTFRWKADDLDAAALDTRVGASALTLGWLLAHLAAVEDDCFDAKLRGGPDPWASDTSADEPAERLYARWDEAVERSRAALDTALADGGLDLPAHVTGPDGQPVSLRRLLCDLVEEYGRHTGHADLLREAVDGLVGEDPPEGWHPRSGGYRLPG